MGLFEHTAFILRAHQVLPHEFVDRFVVPYTDAVLQNLGRSGREQTTFLVQRGLMTIVLTLKLPFQYNTIQIYVTPSAVFLKFKGATRYGQTISFLKPLPEEATDEEIQSVVQHLIDDVSHTHPDRWRDWILGGVLDELPLWVSSSEERSLEEARVKLYPNMFSRMLKGVF